MSHLEDPSVQPKDHLVPRATPLQPQSSRARAGEAAQLYIDTEAIRIWPGALLHVWVDGECFPQAEANVWNLLPWEDTEANYLSAFKKDRHIKEEPEDQRRPWESRKVENKCKGSSVRESGYSLCSGTGLTDQNRSSLVQYYALAVDSTSFREKLLHPSCLAMYRSTLQLHPVHWLVSFSQDALLAHRASQKALLSEQPCCSQTQLKPYQWSNTDFGCATSLLAKTPPSHSHEGTTSQGRRAAEELTARLWQLGEGEPALCDQPALCHQQPVPRWVPVV